MCNEINETFYQKNIMYLTPTIWFWTLQDDLITLLSSIFRNMESHIKTKCIWIVQRTRVRIIIVIVILLIQKAQVKSKWKRTNSVCWLRMYEFCTWLIDIRFLNLCFKICHHIFKLIFEFQLSVNLKQSFS